MTRRDFLQGFMAGGAAIAVNVTNDRAREQVEEGNRRLAAARELARRFLDDCPGCAWLAWVDGDRSFRAERTGTGWRLLEYLDGRVLTRHTAHETRP